MGYMAFKRQAMSDRLTEAVKEWEGAGAKPSDPEPPDGANFAEIKTAWKSVESQNEDFNERLPTEDRRRLELLQEANRKDVLQFDAGSVPKIEGVYLDFAAKF